METTRNKTLHFSCQADAMSTRNILLKVDTKLITPDTGSRYLAPGLILRAFDNNISCTYAPYRRGCYYFLIEIQTSSVAGNQMVLTGCRLNSELQQLCQSSDEALELNIHSGNEEGQQNACNTLLIR